MIPLNNSSTTAQCDLKETAGTRSSPSPRYRRQRFSPTHATRYRRCHRRKMPQAHRAPPGTMVTMAMAKGARRAMATGLFGLFEAQMSSHLIPPLPNLWVEVGSIIAGKHLASSVLHSPALAATQMQRMFGHGKTGYNSRCMKSASNHVDPNPAMAVSKNGVLYPKIQSLSAIFFYGHMLQ